MGERIKCNFFFIRPTKVSRDKIDRRVLVRVISLERWKKNFHENYNRWKETFNWNDPYDKFFQCLLESKLLDIFGHKFIVLKTKFNQVSDSGWPRSLLFILLYLFSSPGRRPCELLPNLASVIVVNNFQNSSPLTPLDQLNPNLVWMCLVVSCIELL